MIQFGKALRAVRKERRWSRGRLHKKLVARFGDDAASLDTLKKLELKPEREPQDWVRDQLTDVLPELAKRSP